VKSYTDIILRFGAICAAILGLAAHYAWGDVLNDRDGRFSANFPGRPTPSLQTVTTDAGPTIAHIFENHGPQGAIYTVVYSDYPAGAMSTKTPDGVYEGAINGVMGETGGTLKSSTAVTAGGVPGREAVIDAPQRKTMFRVRFFLSGDRLYQVAYEGPPGSETGKDAVAFLDSFRIPR
jgi:hypothetical protein